MMCGVRCDAREEYKAASQDSNAIRIRRTRTLREGGNPCAQRGDWSAPHRLFHVFTRSPRTFGGSRCPGVYGRGWDGHQRRARQVLRRDGVVRLSQAGGFYQGVAGTDYGGRRGGGRTISGTLKACTDPRGARHGRSGTWFHVERQVPSAVTVSVRTDERRRQRRARASGGLQSGDSSRMKLGGTS